MTAYTLSSRFLLQNLGLQFASCTPVAAVYPVLFSYAPHLSIEHLTSSTVFLIIYLVTRTSLSCPRRMAREIAWLSTLGFHCSSAMKIRFAQVKFNLRWYQSTDTTKRANNVPKCSGSCCHDENRRLILILKLEERGLPLRQGAVAVELKVWNLNPLQVPRYQIQCSRPAREYDTAHY